MTGTLIAICCALLWAIAARMFVIAGNSFTPIALNFWKGLICIFLISLTSIWVPPADSFEKHITIWLLISGIVGIGIGDTLFFLALNKIGDQQSLLVAETMAPLLTALIAIVWLLEWLNWQQWLGISLVLFCVDMVIKSRQQNDQTHYFKRSGFAFAAAAALCQAIGAVISRDILTQHEINPLHASFVRLIGGFLIIVMLIFIANEKVLPSNKENAGKQWLILLGATFIGTFLALWLQMLAFSLTKAAIVQTLLATSVIFSLAVAKTMGESIKVNTVLWSFGALLGVLILFVYSA